MATCTQCGAELKPGTKFCENCGAKVSDESLHCPECGAKIEVPIELGPGVDSAAGYRESATSPSGGTPNSSGAELR